MPAQLRSGSLVTSLVLAAIIPLLLFGASVAFLLAEASRAGARRDAANTLESVVDRVTAALRKEVDVAQALASLPYLDEPRLDRFYETAQRIAQNRPLWQTVSLADTDGNQQMNILRRLGYPLGPVSDRDSFDRAVRTKQPSIGGVGFIGPVSGKRLVSLSVPIIRNEQVRLVLTIGMSPAEIRGILNKAGAPPDWIGAIVDASGNIIARSNGNNDVGRPASEAVRSAIANAPKGEYNGVAQSGVEVVTLYQRLPATSGWTVHFGVPSEALNGPVSRSTGLLVASCTLCILLAGGLSQRTVRSLELSRREHDEYAALLLAISEERAAVAIEAAELGTWRLDLDADQVSGSMRMRALLRLPEPMEGTADPSWHASQFFSAVYPGDRKRVSKAIDDCCRRGLPLDVEFRVSEPNGSYRWLRAAGRSGREQNELPQRARDTIIQGVLADVDVAKRAQAERVLLMKRLAAAQENEQRRIARELHDQVGQSLTGLSLGLKSLEQDLILETSLRERVVWLQSLTSQISQDIHRAAADLRPAALDDLGLARALSALACDLSLRYSVRFDVQAVGLSERLPSNIENAMFRIVQEAFTNVLKHASATTASVILDRREDVLHVVVEDDGCGFSLGAVVSSGTYCNDVEGVGYKLGLSSIRERLAILAGGLRIESVPEHGTTLFIEIPLQERVNDDS